MNAIPPEGMVPILHPSSMPRFPANQIGVSTSSDPYEDAQPNQIETLQFQDAIVPTIASLNIGAVTLQSETQRGNAGPSRGPELCPIHNTVDSFLSLDFPELGIDERYCILCIRDLLRKFITPLGEKPVNISWPVAKETLSRYTILKNESKTNEK